MYCGQVYFLQICTAHARMIKKEDKRSKNLCQLYSYTTFPQVWSCKWLFDNGWI